MNISKITSLSNSSIKYKANLYRRNKEIKKSIFDTNDLSEMGSEKTNIYVNNVKSVPNSSGWHNNIIFFTLSNPILGSIEFNNINIHQTLSKLSANEEKANQELYKHFSFDSLINFLEKKTLESTLTRKVKDAVCANIADGYPTYETNAEKIFNKMLEKKDYKEAGFSDEDIAELKETSKKLNNKILLAGAEALLKKEKDLNYFLIEYDKIKKDKNKSEE